MYHVSAQGVDERMINVHYYYSDINEDVAQWRRFFHCIDVDKKRRSFSIGVHVLYWGG